MTLNQCKIAYPLELFSLFHAFCTLVLIFSVYALTYYYPSSQLSWLVLSSVLISQTGLLSETKQSALWQILFYPCLGLLAGLTVFALSLCATHFLYASLLVIVLTGITGYWAWRDRQFFGAAFVIQVLGIITAFFPSDLEMAKQRFFLILLGSILVLLIRSPYRLLYLCWKFFFARVRYFQKLKYIYQLIFYTSGPAANLWGQELEESHFQLAWSDCLTAMQELKNIISVHLEEGASAPPRRAQRASFTVSLDHIWDLSLSLGSLRYRLTEEAVFRMAQAEMRGLSEALMQVLNQLSYSKQPGQTLSLTGLQKAIQEFEELYQSMLQTVAKEPLVILLFIQDLYALKDALEKLSLNINHVHLEHGTNIDPVRPEEGASAPPQRASHNNPWKPTLRSVLAVSLALFINHYFLKTPHYWLPLTAAILAQTELAYPVYYSLRRLLWILFAFYLGIQLRPWLPELWQLPLMITAISTLTAYGYAYTSRRYLGLHFSLLLMIVLLLTFLMPLAIADTSTFFDILIGGALGVGTILLIWPDKPAVEFPKRVIPLLQACSDYMQALMSLVLREDQAETETQLTRQALEQRWANKEDYFPVWVYEAGFNPALKAGQYYFVVHLGQITEILFAMHHFARYEFPQDLLNPFVQSLYDCTQHSQELMTNIMSLLEGKKLAFSKTDFIGDIHSLEEHFRSAVPLSLELLDISRDYVYLAAFIRYLKDLRLQLLQLAATFRSP